MEGRGREGEREGRREREGEREGQRRETKRESQRENGAKAVKLGQATEIQVNVPF